MTLLSVGASSSSPPPLHVNGCPHKVSLSLSFPTCCHHCHLSPTPHCPVRALSSIIVVGTWWKFVSPGSCDFHMEPCHMPHCMLYPSSACERGRKKSKLCVSHYPCSKKKGKWVTHPGDCHSPYYAAIISCLRTNRDDEPEAPTRWQEQHCYSPTLRDHFSMDLLFFFPFILSYLIISDFKPWDSLWELTYLTPLKNSQHMFASWQTLFY